MGGINPTSRTHSPAPLRAARAAAERSGERLSSGLRINRGSDDPSGLIASEALGARRAELSARIRGLERESSFLNARDGAMMSLGDLASDLGGLVVGGANSGAMGAGGIDAVGAQVAGIVGAIDARVSGAGFNGFSVPEGLGSSELGRTQIGTDADGQAVFATVGDIGRLMVENPGAAQAVARQAVEDIAVARAEVGVRQRAAESERRAAEAELINTARAQSRIRDTNYAKAASDAARAGLLGEAAMRAEIIGRKSSAMVLDLLA